MDPIWNDNAYTMASWPEFAKKYELTTLSDLAGFYEKMEENIETFVDFEFSVRPDGLPAMEKFYKLNTEVDIEKMEPREVANKYLIEHGLIKQ